MYSYGTGVPRENSGGETVLVGTYVVGGTLIVFSGFWCGNEMVRKWRSHRLALEETTQMLWQILEEVQYRALPVPDILHVLQKNDQYMFLALKECMQLQCLSPPDYFSKEEAARFTYCLSELGRKGTQAQCEQLRNDIVYFQKCGEQIREKERAAAAICPKIGLCVGAMAALALL